MLLAHVLPGVVERHSRAIAVSIDLSRMFLLLGVCVWLGDGDLLFIATAGLLYASTPVLTMYNVQLNPRGLGAILLDGVIILLLWKNLLAGPEVLWIPIILLCGLIPLTHKMTTQLFWFLCIAMTVATGMVEYLALVPISIIAALLLSRGFYVKVLLAHWDIVTFWYRNWRWLGAHPVASSPVYERANEKSGGVQHEQGMAGIVKHAKYLFGVNPGSWILVVVAVVLITKNDLPSEIDVIFYLIVLVLGFALATVFVPVLKCIGLGYHYLYNVAFLVAILGGYVVVVDHPVAQWVCAGAVALNLVVLVAYYYRVSRQSQRTSGDFDRVLQTLSGLPHGVVMCFPQQWYDEIAYKTKQPVLYGGHGYGFKDLEPIFPRLLLPIRSIIEQFDVRYVLTTDGYLSEEVLAEVPCVAKNRFGHYLLIQCVDSVRGPDAGQSR
jgi:hypothetical protein